MVTWERGIWGWASNWTLEKLFGSLKAFLSNFISLVFDAKARWVLMLHVEMSYSIDLVRFKHFLRH